MSNPYGWSPPTNGQPAVYFAAPGEQIPVSAPAVNPAPGAPYDNGYGQYQSFVEQYNYQSQVRDPFAAAGSGSFQSLSARGARRKVSMLDAVILWLKNWRNFSGRASRSEYWWVTFAQMLVQALWFVLLFGLVQMQQLSPSDPSMNLLVLTAVGVMCLAALLTVIPTLSLTVRRLHDTDHSGWFYLVQFLPFGGAYLSYLLGKGSDSAGWRFDDYMQPLYGPDDLD